MSHRWVMITSRRRRVRRQDIPSILTIAALFTLGFFLAGPFLIAGLIVMLAAALVAALRFPRRYRRY